MFATRRNGATMRAHLRRTSVRGVCGCPAIAIATLPTVLSMDEEDDLSDLVNGSDQYGDELKLKCMYSVLHRFSRFLRLGVFPDDTRFLFVATLCRLIDVARKRHPPQSDSPAFDLWDLNALSNEQDTFLGTSNSVASPGLASTAERMNWLEQLILRNDYIK